MAVFTLFREVKSLIEMCSKMVPTSFRPENQMRVIKSWGRMEVGILFFSWVRISWRLGNMLPEQSMQKIRWTGESGSYCWTVSGMAIGTSIFCSLMNNNRNFHFYFFININVVLLQFEL